MLVRVQGMDLYKHFGSFLLVWVPPMDLYEHRQEGIGICLAGKEELFHIFVLVGLYMKLLQVLKIDTNGGLDWQAK